MKTVARKISEVKQEIVSVRQEMELVRTQYTARLAQLEKELDVVSKNQHQLNILSMTQMQLSSLVAHLGIVKE